MARGGLLFLLLISMVPLLLRAQILNEEGKKEVPNIFTPNGDGINDLLKLESAQELDFTVYNRLGNVVYRYASKTIEWDGTNAYGDALPDGIYYFTLVDPAGEYAVNRGFFYISRASVK